MYSVMIRAIIITGNQCFSRCNALHSDTTAGKKECHT